MINASADRFLHFDSAETSLKSTISDDLWRQVFTCFTQAQFGHFVPVAVDKALYPFGVGFAVIAQCPADGFVDEKFFLPQIVADDFFQQRGVGALFAEQLVVDGDAAQPDVVVGAPCQ